MTINSNIITLWDKKLIAYTLKHYQALRSEHNQGIKPHSLITILALFGTSFLLSFMSDVMFENVYGQGFIVVLRGLMGAVCIVAYFAAFYHWRVLWILRKDGIDTDKNLFFAESAGRSRKSVFYIVLALDIVRRIQSYLHPEEIGQQMRRLKYQLRSEYYHDVGIAVLDSIILSILFIEFMRIIYPGSFSWSDKKHIVVVSLMPLAISSFKIFALNLTSGHGVI